MLNNVPNYQSLTPQEIVAYLTESVSVPTNRVITLGVLREALTQEAYFLVRQTLEAATVPQSDSVEAKAVAADISDALAALRTVGISLSGTDRQSAIDILAAAGRWPDPLRDLIKSLGRYWLPRWQHLGLANEPTVESVEAELAAEALEAKKNQLRAQFDSILNQIGTIEQSQAVDALRSIADELEA
jgi:hypothetical protein